MTQQESNLDTEINTLINKEHENNNRNNEIDNIKQEIMHQESEIEQQIKQLKIKQISLKSKRKQLENEQSQIQIENKQFQQQIYELILNKKQLEMKQKMCEINEYKSNENDDQKIDNTNLFSDYLDNGIEELTFFVLDLENINNIQQKTNEFASNIDSIDITDFIDNKNEIQNASDFRHHSFYEFIYLIRDIFCLIPFLIIVVTLFRLPMLILTIISKLRTPRTSINDIIHFDIEEASLEFQEKGKPRIWINKATKNMNFGLNNAKEGFLRLFVLGDEFWNDISNIFGAAIATAGQSMLPNKLSHGINKKTGLNYGTSNGLNYDLITDGITEINDIPFEIQQFIGKRSTILKNLNKFEDLDRKFIFQLEHDEYGILFIICVSIRDLIECAQSDNGFYQLQKQTNFGLSFNEINKIRGNIDSGGIVDIFWIIVCMEFVHLLIDISHFILLLILICIPWR
eukprot:172268_1